LKGGNRCFPLHLFKCSGVVCHAAPTHPKPLNESMHSLDQCKKTQFALFDALFKAWAEEDNLLERAGAPLVPPLRGTPTSLFHNPHAFWKLPSKIKNEFGFLSVILTKNEELHSSD
jgi:hypothetical protein